MLLGPPAAPSHGGFSWIEGELQSPREMSKIAVYNAIVLVMFAGLGQARLGLSGCPTNCDDAQGVQHWTTCPWLRRTLAACTKGENFISKKMPCGVKIGMQRVEASNFHETAASLAILTYVKAHFQANGTVCACPVCSLSPST